MSPVMHDSLVFSTIFFDSFAGAPAEELLAERRLRGDDQHFAPRAAHLGATAARREEVERLRLGGGRSGFEGDERAEIDLVPRGKLPQGKSAQSLQRALGIRDFAALAGGEIRQLQPARVVFVLRLVLLVRRAIRGGASRGAAERQLTVETVDDGFEKSGFFHGGESRAVLGRARVQ